MTPSSPAHAAPTRGRSRRFSKWVSVAGVVALAATTWTGVAVASDEDQTPTPSATASAPQADATTETTSEQTQPAGDASTGSPSIAGGSTAAPEESATTDAPAATAGTDVPAAPEPKATTPSKAPAFIQARDVQVQLLAAGPDGAVAPYVYWTVKDATSGQLIAGATFSLQRRSGNIWTGTRNVTDCVASGCTVVDRDPDGGDYLAKWIGRDNPGTSPSDTGASSVIQAGGRYRVQPVNPPTGYRWVSSTAWVDSQNLAWQGSDANKTLNFGTFRVEKASHVPVCTAGYVYGIQDNGTILQVKPDGSFGAFSASAVSSGGDFNGVGIGSGGSPVFAYNRSNSSHTATIWQYDVTSNAWTNKSVTVDSTTEMRTVKFVAGAVNLDTGKYFIGGFSIDGTVFRIWQYDPSTNTAIYKGQLDTSSGAGIANNGDMAFDAAGNLFVVRGSGSTTTVFSVVADDLASGSGGIIPSSVSKSVSGTTSNVNGVAFDAIGRGFLSSGTQVQSYAMPGWSDQDTVVSSGFDSNDLASCSSPPTITVEKYIDGNRVNAGDQFKLTLTQGTQTIGDATTTGSTAGLQGQRIGPLPTVRGVPLTFSESAAGTTDLTKYVSSFRCLVDGVQTVQGNGTTGSITIPSEGESVDCQFYNSPLVANVTIHKDVTDLNGGNAASRPGWEVGAGATATAGSVGRSPAQDTLLTDAAGDAKWSLTFGGKNDRADVVVSETAENGYSFQSGSCSITHLDGTVTNTVLKDGAPATLSEVAPGDQVNCTYTNKPDSAKLTLVKQVTNSHGGAALATAWTLAATGATTTVSGATGTSGVTKALVPTGSYALSESGTAAGYQAGSWSCSPVTVTGSSVTLTKDADVTCTITNSDQPGSVTWTKTDNSSQALSGSQWTLTGPGAASGTAVTDCTQAPCPTSAFTDQDSAPGKFTLSNLTWGDYSLVESKAPVGYVLDTTKHTFTVGPNSGQIGVPGPISVGTFKNTPLTVPSLPLTGGLGTDTFLLAGGGLLALAGIGGWIHRRRSLRVQRA